MPATLPSFLPVGPSSSMPTQSPAANEVPPMKCTMPRCVSVAMSCTKSPTSMLILAAFLFWLKTVGCFHGLAASASSCFFFCLAKGLPFVISSCCWAIWDASFTSFGTGPCPSRCRFMGCADSVRSLTQKFSTTRRVMCFQRPVSWGRRTFSCKFSTCSTERSTHSKACSMNWAAFRSLSVQEPKTRLKSSKDFVATWRL
mmetsp:Transcript_35500/g.75692  ORF Transcript_35500/g.75692 Transcript_35500/m.75692 type:complete len:200 (-) Transcript_35500:2418-3017(-)